jgi:cellulose synthase (UDP-forming)
LSETAAPPARHRAAARLPGRISVTDRRTVPVWRPPLRVHILILANIMAASFYLVWWITPGHRGMPALFVMLAVAEAFALIHNIGLWWAVWATQVSPPPPAVTAHTIDVFIPTRGEPIPVLARTIAAAVGMDGEQTVWVCDDAEREEVRELAERLGAGYITRGKGGRGAKAGNLNHALSETYGELFAIFDADHVPRRDFLTQLLGYFEDERLAFAQTPQYYGNARHNEVARGAYQQQAIFYGPICRGKNGLQSAFCCGTNVIFRREAIESVGGFDEKSVVEDFVTSMRIHRKGWHSVYYPYVLAEGLGPASVAQFFRQQFRWARGSVGALASLEPFKRGFTIGQRVQYLLATTFYLIGLTSAIYVSLPLLYLFFGWSAFSVGSGTFLFFYAPYLVLAMLTIRWGLGGQLRMEHLQYTFGTFPVYAVAGVAALFHIPARFKATGAYSDTKLPALFWVTAGVFVATAVAVVAGPFLQGVSIRTFTNVSWGLINLMLMYGIVRAGMRGLRYGVAGADDAASVVPEGDATELPTMPPIAGGAPDAWESAGSAVLDGPELTLPEHAFEARPRRSLRSLTSTDERRWVLGLTALGFVLRAALIGVQSMRLDESVSLSQVEHHSFTGLWHYLMTSNVHVPLYHSMLYGWVRVFGDSLVSIRIPSVIIGTACIPLLFVVARRIVGDRAALITTAIGAVSPFWVWHSDEARMYPLLVLMVLASLALLFRALDRDRFRDWAVFAMVTGIGLYSHYFAILMIPVQFVFLMVYRTPKRKILHWFGAMVVVGLMFLPWVIGLYVLRVEAAGASSLSSAIRLPGESYSFFSIVFGFIYFLLVYMMGYAEGLRGIGIITVVSVMIAASWPLIAVRGVMSRRLNPGLRKALLFLGLWLVLTVGLIYVVNIYKTGIWVQRYLIVASPAVFMIAAVVLAQLIRSRVALIAAVVVLLGAVAIAQNFTLSNPAAEAWNKAAGVVKSNWQTNDAVLVFPGYDASPFQYYFNPGNDLYGYFQSYADLPNTLFCGLATVHAGQKLFIAVDTLHASRTHPEIQQLLLPYFDARYQMVNAWTYGNITVYEYQLPATPIC